MKPPQSCSLLQKFSILHYQFSIIMILLLLLTPNPTFAASKIALVIGNSQYEFDPLPNPENDAADMAGVLEKLGFEVILEKDADKSAMVQSLREFHKKLGTADIGLFYYAGHGMQINGHNYLIPVRHAIAEAFEVESEAIGADRILSAMESAGNPLNIVILDACRNNPFQSFRGAQKGLAEMSAPRGTIISYATSPGSLAEDGRGRNGTYTEALLKNFQVPGVDVQKMFNRTGLDVMEKTDGRQIPWMSKTPFPDFYLAGGTPKDQNLPPEKPQHTQPRQVQPQPVTSAQLSIQEPWPEVSKKAQLYVVTEPGGGRVRIMNIVEKYHDGIELDPGRYMLEGSLEGHQAKTRWITIDKSGAMDVTLTLTPEPLVQQKPVAKASQKAQLYVVTDPGGGQVRLLDFAERYYDGIELDLGRYKIEGTLDGYRIKNQWITIDRLGVKDVTLTLTPEPIVQTVVSPAKTDPAKAAPGKATKPVTTPASSRPTTAEKVALVIGNSQYYNSPLKNPVNDAMDMADLLKKKGFDVILLTDAGKRGMLESIEAFGSKLTQAKIAMLYFSGHGIQIKGRNYLIPVNARVESKSDLEQESVDVYEILDRMEAAANPVNIIILDACRDNPFEPFFRTPEKGLALIHAPDSSIIILATVPGGVVEESRARNSIFTSHLLKNFQIPGLQVDEVFNRTGLDVMKKTGGQQMPWISSSLLRQEVYVTGEAP